MYLCVCNAINEDDAEEAIKAGAENAEEIHQYFGASICCGKCLSEIEEFLTQEKANDCAD